MLWSLTDVEVRRARLSDAADLIGVHQASWWGAYHGLIPHNQLEHMISRRTLAWWRSTIRSRDEVLLLAVGGTVAGYATCGPARRQTGPQGEIYELYMAPAYQGLGFGECLFEGCRACLDRKGLNGLIVWVLADNHTAIDFYWGRGGRPHSESVEHFGGRTLKKIALRWN